MQILTERVCSFTTTTEREINILKKLFFIDSDYGTELKPTAETDKEETYELSDVNNTTVGAERLRCAEVLFQPGLTGKETSGIHYMSSRTKCVVDIRKELYASVVSSGGTAMFQGTGERMTREPTALASSTMNIKVVVPIQYGLEDRSCQRAPRRKHHHCRSERFRWGESVVQATSTPASGLHDTSFWTKCVVDIRKELYASVVSSGGTTMFHGTVERMAKGYFIHDEDQDGCSDSARISGFILFPLSFLSRCGL